ncbi:hypothetical protein L6R29_04570 [Myxococcota bacterium]|nr:hypothetical protein [Myxococcota bacterium]
MPVNATLILWGALLGLPVLFLLWRIKTFFVRVSGRWFEQKDPNAPRQEIHLSQLGPYVWGVAEVAGGELRYSGWFDGTRLRLRRRDLGRGYLASLGFSEDVLGELDGSEMTRFFFVYRPEKGELVGEQHPQKIELSRTKPKRIVSRVYLAPIPRLWTRR